MSDYHKNYTDQADTRIKELESLVHSLRVRIVNVVTERDRFNTQLQDAKKEIQRLEELQATW